MRRDDRVADVSVGQEPKGQEQGAEVKALRRLGSLTKLPIGNPCSFITGKRAK